MSIRLLRTCRFAYATGKAELLHELPDIVMWSFTPVFSCMIRYRSFVVIPESTTLATIPLTVPFGILLGRPLLGRFRKPSGPPSPYLLSQLCTQLGYCIRLSTASSTDRLCTRTVRTVSILFLTLRFFSLVRPLELFPFDAIHALPVRDQIHILFVQVGYVFTNFGFSLHIGLILLGLILTYYLRFL